MPECPAPSRGRFRAGAFALPLLALALGACAPHIVSVPDLTPGARSERYRTALTARETRGAAVEAQVLLWAEVPADSRLPGAEGRLLLAGPNAFRLRVGSLFGTALDLGVRGDSVRAYLPSRRQGMALDARYDSLGIARPGGLAFRALSAAWRPPEAAWAEAVWRDTLLRVWWLEDADTVGVAIGSNGLPASAAVTRPGIGEIRVTYRLWDRSGGTPWPAVVGIEDSEGGFRLTCKVVRLSFQARQGAARLTVPIPPSAQRLTVAELRDALAELGD